MSWQFLFPSVPWSVDELWDSFEMLGETVGTVMNGALYAFIAITGVYILLRIVYSIIH